MVFMPGLRDNSFVHRLVAFLARLCSIVLRTVSRGLALMRQAFMHMSHSSFHQVSQHIGHRVVQLPKTLTCGHPLRCCRRCMNRTPERLRRSPDTPPPSTSRNTPPPSPSTPPWLMRARPLLARATAGRDQAGRYTMAAAPLSNGGRPVDDVDFALMADANLLTTVRVAPDTHTQGTARACLSGNDTCPALMCV
jgi:hypothetical protein